MANRNGFVQSAPLPPLNSPTITEADRARVYGVIGKELNNILNGATSYHADSVKKSSRDLKSELKNFIGVVESLKDAVNDPANIVGDVIRDLRGVQDAFETGTSNDIETMWNDPNDKRDGNIKLPDSLAPTTDDHNIIDVDPNDDGPFAAPNPVSPNRPRKDLRASTGSSIDVATNGAKLDTYPRLMSRVGSFAPGSTNPLNAKQPSLAPAESFAFSDNPNFFGGGLAGRIAALADGAPRNPYPPVPMPGDPNPTRSDARNIPVLTSRIVSRDSVGSASLSSAESSNQPGRFSQPSRPLGLFTGQPMPNYPFPPPIFGFPDNSRTPADDGEDWFKRWGPLVRP